MSRVVARLLQPRAPVGLHRLEVAVARRDRRRRRPGRASGRRARSAASSTSRSSATARAASSVNAPANTDEPRERLLLAGLEQVVAPVDRRRERLLARQQRAAAAGEQAEAVVEPREDLVDAHRAHPRRRELDGERDAVEARADRCDRRRRCRAASAKPGRPRGGAVAEQSDGVEACAARRCGGSSSRSGIAIDGTRQTISPGHVEHLPARGEHARAPGSARVSASTSVAHSSSRCSQLSSTSSIAPVPMRSAIDSASARSASSCTPSTSATWRATVPLPASDASSTYQTPSGWRSLRSAAIWSARRVLPQPPEPVSVTSRFASSSSPTSRSSLVRPMNDVSCAGRLFGDASRPRSGGEVVAQVGVTELEHLLGPAEVLQPVRAEIAPGRARRRVHDEVAGRARRDDLAAVRERSQARGADHRLAEVVELVAQLGVAGVQRHAHVERGALGPRLRRRAAAALRARRPRRRSARLKAATMLSPSPCSTGRTPWWRPTASARIS